jgi:hypothetical protein
LYSTPNATFYYTKKSPSDFGFFHLLNDEYDWVENSAKAGMYQYLDRPSNAYFSEINADKSSSHGFGASIRLIRYL